MSKALAVLKVFFSLVSINSTESPSSVSSTTSGVTRSTLTPTKLIPSLKEVVYVGRAFRIPITQESYTDVINWDKTKPRFAMKTSNNGDIRPSSWIQFDNIKREVYGFPLPGNVGRYYFKILISNNTGALILQIKFELQVQPKANEFEYSHEVILKTGTKFLYNQFMTSVEKRTDFVSKLARYCFNEKPSTVWIRTFSKETRTLTVVFVNIPYSPCIEETYKKLKSKLVDENSNIEPQFQQALTERFPIQSAQFKFFGACDPNMLGPLPPFEWGWLKHFIPVAMILAVVGIPVTISCLVNRRRTKPPVVEERRPRTLRQRNEDGTHLTSHTVHFNNRYPSMLSVSNNSKEDNIGDDEKGHSGRSNIPNGSPASKHLTVPNATPNRPKQGSTSSANTTAKNKKSPFNFASNEERANFDVRAMWDDDDDAEPTPLNIPTYYTYRNNEEEQPSMIDAMFDMNLSGIAENISKGVKSMLNIQGETTAQETKPLETTNSGSSLSSKLKGLGKSMLNISTVTNEPAMAGGMSSGEAAAPSLSSKLRDFGKSMLNIPVSAQGDDKKDVGNGSQMQKAVYDDSEDSDSYIYKPREYDDARTERRGYGDARQNYDHVRHDYGDSRRGYDDSRRGYHDARQDYDGSRQGYGDVRRQGYDHTRQDHDHVREDYEDSRRGYDDAQQSYDFTRGASSEYESSRFSNHRHSNTSEYELAQYNLEARRLSSASEHLHRTRDNHDSYCYNPAFEGRPANRRSSREDDFDEYPDSFFDAPSEHSLKSDHEKSIFDVDYDDAEEDTPCLAKPKPIWNHTPVSKARESLGITSLEMNDVKYRDYTNPHQYSNGPTRVLTRAPRGKPSYSALGTSSFSSQSTLDFWDDEEYDGKSGWKQSSDIKNDFFSSFTNSVPDLRRGQHKGGIPNGTKPQSHSKQKQGNSLFSDVGSLISGEKPPVVFTLGDSDDEDYKQQQQNHHQQQQQQQQQQPERKSSLVGLIKTGVSSILEPDGNVSKWFSGFQKSDNPVT